LDIANKRQAGVNSRERSVSAMDLPCLSSSVISFEKLFCISILIKFYTRFIHGSMVNRNPKPSYYITKLYTPVNEQYLCQKSKQSLRVAKKARYPGQICGPTKKINRLLEIMISKINAFS
jgi:hypothetical protein